MGGIDKKQKGIHYPAQIFLRGDEFVVFTNSREMDHANEIVRKVSAQDMLDMITQGIKEK